jgi:hypothetical protein
MSFPPLSFSIFLKRNLDPFEKVQMVPIGFVAVLQHQFRISISNLCYVHSTHSFCGSIRTRICLALFKKLVYHRTVWIMILELTRLRCPQGNGTIFF